MIKSKERLYKKCKTFTLCVKRLCYNERMKTQHKMYAAEVSEWLEDEITRRANSEGVSEGEFLVREFIRHHSLEFARAMGLRSAGLCKGSCL